MSSKWRGVTAENHQFGQANWHLFNRKTIKIEEIRLNLTSMYKGNTAFERVL